MNRDYRREIKFSIVVLLLMLAFSIAVWLLSALMVSVLPDRRETGSWYIGCVDTVSGQQYLLKADQKPELRDGFIIIGKETFITPRPMMTCRVVSEEELTTDSAGDML